jgi:hypothetical protein
MAATRAGDEASPVRSMVAAVTAARGRLDAVIATTSPHPGNAEVQAVLVDMSALLTAMVAITAYPPDEFSLELVAKVVVGAFDHITTVLPSGPPAAGGQHPATAAVTAVLAATRPGTGDLRFTVWEEPCGRCLAAGVIEDPAWSEWWAEDDRRKAAWAGQADAPDRTGWMASAEHQAHEAEGMPEGEQEIPCPACLGARTVPTPAGQALLAFLRKHR